MKQYPNRDIGNKEPCIAKEFIITDPGFLIVHEYYSNQELTKLIYTHQSIQTHILERKGIRKEEHRDDRYYENIEIR